MKLEDGGLHALCYGRARKFGSMSVFSSYGVGAFGRPRVISRKEFAGQKPGPWVPRKWDHNDWIAPPRNDKIAMRQIAVSALRGRGVEFGAGARPAMVPLDVEVLYAEHYFTPAQMHRMYGHTRNYMIPELVDSFDDQQSIPPGSLDFIIASHVIEHTRNPAKAIADSYRSLRPGGQLVLIVPDKRYTFDRSRDLTTIEHVIEDYYDPSPARDFRHYLEFFWKVKKLKYPEVEAERAAAKGGDIHFHVWNFASFTELLSEVRRTIAPFSELWRQERVDDPQCLENYFVLSK